MAKGSRGTTIASAYVQLKPSAEGLNAAIGQAMTEATEGGVKASSGKISSIAGKVGKIAGAAALTAVTAVGTAVASMTKQAVNAYAEYEQLSGGVETLFGKAAQAVERDAAQAYKTAGLSQNQYMEAVNGMAAALNQATGDQFKSAQAANQAVIDMADNANKMGTSMELIMNAYAGFTKQNFTMLDNLKLGYGGTKQEMERLLEDAQKLSGVEYNIENYADIVEAIHVIQEEMGVAGTTAEEATGTISGSLAMVKSAWENLVAGIANENADMGGLIDNLLSSVFGTDTDKGFLDNILPRISTALDGIIEFAAKSIPRIADRIGEITKEYFPTFLTSILGVLGSLTDILPTAVSTVVDIIKQVLEAVTKQLPDVLKGVLSAVISALGTIIDNLPEILTMVLDVIDAVTDAVLNVGLPMLLDALPDLLDGIINFVITGIPKIITSILNVTDAILGALPMIISKLIPMIPRIIMSVITALVESLPELIDAIVHMAMQLTFAAPLIVVELIKALPEIIVGIVDAFKDSWPLLKEAWVQMWSSMVDGPQDGSFMAKVQDVIGDIFTTIGGAIEDFFGPIKEKVVGAFTNAIEGIKAFGSAAVNAVKEFFQPAVDKGIAIWQWFNDTFGPLINAFKNLFSAIMEAIAVIAVNVWEKIRGVVETVWTAIVNFVTPIIETIKNAVEVGFNFIHEKIVTPLQNAWQKVTEVWNNIFNKFKEIISSIHDYVAERFEAIKNKMTEPLNKAKELVSNVFNTIKETILNVVRDAANWGRDMIQNIIGGIKEKMSGLTDTINGVASAIHDRLHFSEPDVGPLANFSTYAPDMMKTFAEGIRDNTAIVTQQVERSFNIQPVMTAGMQQTPALAGAGAGNVGTIIIPVYLGGRQIDEVVVDALNRQNYITGGR